MFCPFINDECRNDCVFKKGTCEILKISDNIDSIQRQTVDCSYISDISSKLDKLINSTRG